MMSERTALQLDREAWAAQDERDRLDDEARGQRWIDFVNTIRSRARDSEWHMVIADVSDAMEHVATETEWLLSDAERPHSEFAATEGWPSVLRAIAQAMDADAAERAEVERRR